jgi:DNA polymerase-1
MSRRARHRAQDRDPADPAIWRPGNGAGLDRPDQEAQAQAVLIDHADNGAAVARLVELECTAAARAARGSGAEGHPARAAQGIPRGHGVQVAAGTDGRRRRRVERRERGRRHGVGARARQAPAEKEKITVDRTQYETVISEEALDRWIAEARHQGYVAIDTETDCIEYRRRLAGISLATQPNKACYIPIGHVGGDLYSDAPKPAFRWRWCWAS